MTSRVLLLFGVVLAGLSGWAILRWTAATSGAPAASEVAAPDPAAAREGAYGHPVEGLAPSSRSAAGASHSELDAAVAEGVHGPHGRIALADGRGVSAVRVALLGSGSEEPLAVAATDGRGSFELPAGTRGSRLRVSPDPRYAFEPVELVLTPAQRAGGAPAEILARLMERTPLVGILRDAATDEPVPEFKLWFWDSIGTDEWVVTDVEGRFETRDVFGTGRLVAALIDFEGSFARYGRAELERLRPFDELVVPVDLGPTYRLAFTPPAGYPPSEFFAEVRGHRRTARHYPYFFMRSRVRAGEPCWVRLHPGEVTEGPGPPWHLTLVSDDGLWAGSVPVDQRAGHCPSVLPFEVRPAGALRALVRDDDGEAVSLQFELRAEAGDFQDDDFQDWVWSNQDGELRYRGLMPGAVELSARAPGYEPFSRSLQIQAGRELVFDIEVVRREPVGDLAGEVQFSDIASIDDAWVNAQGPDGLWRSASLEPIADDGTRLAFTLRGLPAGRWRLRSSLADQGFAVEPPELFVEPPATGLVFRVHATAAPVPLRVEVCDGSGEPLRENLVLYRVEGGETWRCEDADFDEHLFESYVPGIPLRVTVLAPGRAPWRGDGSQFELVAGELVGRAALAPGWGVHFVLTDPDGAPVAGVRLLLDGASTAASDAEGGILANATSAPTRLGLENGAWALSPANGAVEAASGRFEPRGLEMGILLEPRR